MSMKMVAFISAEQFVEGHGYRVSFVVDGEDGYRPTGNWPYTGAPGETLPWFWGPTFEDAERTAREYNARMGISETETFEIIARSMTTLRRRHGGSSPRGKR
jgi:hypothetical protein